MGEKKKTMKKFITKETIISAIVGLIVGVAITFLIGYCLNLQGMSHLRYGKESIASVNGKSVTTQKIYDNMKTSYALSYLISEVDKAIFNDMYTLTEKEEEEVKEEAEYWFSYYEAMGTTQEEFLENYGFENYEDFLEELRASYKSDKYLYDYLESKLEEGAVQKYYDENKSTIETYDSEHILVKISDDVTDEQALALANEIIGKLNEGKTFDEVIEEYGDKIIHEELGYQGQESGLEQSYVDELVALQDGEYSKTPVKTSYGYHIVHKIATSTLEDLRTTIIDTLTEDMLSEDSTLTYKAYVEIRKEKNLEIYDEQLKKQYEEYCTSLYES